MAEFKVRPKRSRRNPLPCPNPGCPHPITHSVVESGVEVAQGCEWHAHAWARSVNAHHRAAGPGNVKWTRK